MELESVITAFHKGSFEYRICVIKNYDPKNPANEQAQLTEGCLEEHVLVSRGRKRQVLRLRFWVPAQAHLVVLGRWVAQVVGSHEG